MRHTAQLVHALFELMQELNARLNTSFIISPTAMTVAAHMQRQLSMVDGLLSESRISSDISPDSRLLWKQEQLPPRLGQP